ncbi:MAG TPA: thiamine phosphate synthase [Candidatus Eisenbacteria bacterium]
MTPFRLILITDRATARLPLLEAVEAALAGGVDAVQLRDKDLPADERYRLGRELSAMVRRHGAQFLVNDRIDLALALRAHGVQLGAASLPIGQARRLLPPECRIGYSAHSPAEAEGAALAGADFVVLAPVYAPGSKSARGGVSDVARPPLPPRCLGAGTVRATAAALTVPVYALGGITPDRITEVMAPPTPGESSPAGVAVISHMLASQEPGAAARDLARALGAAS